MKGWIGTLISVAIIAFAVLAKETSWFGNVPMIDQPVTMTVLAGTICLVLVLALQTPESAVSRQVALWFLSGAIVALAATNITQINNKRENMAQEEIKANAVKRKEAAKKHRKKKRKAAQDLLPDTPEINKRTETVYDPSKYDPLAPKPGQREHLTNQLTTPEIPLDENWEPSEKQKRLFREFLRSKGLRYDPVTAYKFPPSSDADNNLFK